MLHYKKMWYFGTQLADALVVPRKIVLCGWCRPSLQEVAAEQSGELFMAPDDKAGYVSTVTAQDLLADLQNEMLREVLLERLRLRQLQHQVLLPSSARAP